MLRSQQFPCFSPACSNAVRHRSTWSVTCSMNHRMISYGTTYSSWLWMWTVGSRFGSSSGTSAIKTAGPGKWVTAASGFRAPLAGAGTASLSSTDQASSGKA